MIPAAFEYHRPKNLSDAISILNERGDDARVMAGGHSLIPMMKLRMAEVPHLIDLQDVDGLRGIEIGETIVIGAMATQAEIIDHEGLAEAAPILREAALQIADPQVRNIGTLGGNVANGDPGNDMPAVMQCLDARFAVAGPGGSESLIPARDFYEGAYMTAREDNEILTSVSFARPSRGYAYEKQKRKIGDYATAAAAVQLDEENGCCSGASIAMTNLGGTPVWSEAAGAALVGASVGEAAAKAAVEAMLEDIDPAEDNRGPIAFKRHAAGIALARAIERAWSRV